MVGEAASHRAELQSGLRQPHEIVSLPPDAAHSALFDHKISEADIVISLRFSRKHGAAPAFRLLHVPGAGLDGIDLDGLAPGTRVCNVYEHETPIAEYVLRCLLEWEARPSRAAGAFTGTSWSDLYRRRVPHGEISGKTIGLIGHGRVGKAIARRARALGLRVVAVTRSIATADDDVEILPTTRLDQLLDVSDYVVVACPLTSHTRGMIGRQELARMKRTAILINPSRAAIVKERALYEALAEGVIAGAFLDVWYRYPKTDSDRPPPSAYPFWELPTVWCTPHSSAWTEEVFRRRYRVIADNINRLAAGRGLRNIVPR
ncbi:MAG: 2-hydroxyacid dehydrogenase [Micromonosporaceae bacterium]